MNRADDHELGGRRIDIEKQLPAVGLDHAALAHPQLLCEIGAQGIGGDILGLYDTLLAIGGIGDTITGRRAARSVFTPVSV